MPPSCKIPRQIWLSKLAQVYTFLVIHLQQYINLTFSATISPDTTATVTPLAVTVAAEASTKKRQRPASAKKEKLDDAGGEPAPKKPPKKRLKKPVVASDDETSCSNNLTEPATPKRVRRSPKKKGDFAKNSDTIFDAVLQNTCQGWAWA